MIRIDASGWAKRNLWPLQNGELAVRPGLRHEFDGSASLSGRRVVDGFSVLDPVTGDAWFYLVHYSTSGAADVKINVYDDNWTLFQEYDTGSDAIPEVVTHAEVLDFITISSPSFPTVFGLVGGGLIKAEKQDSLNSFLTSLDVPAGICTAWASSRVVIARGSSLFISDPVTATGGDPRTFVAENQVYLEAPIYGLHTTAGGALVACTARGVYALSEQAAASGQVPVGDWQKLSDHQTTRFKTTASVNGRLWGLVKKGIQLIDVEGASEVALDDPEVSPVDVASIRNSDYRRNCELIAGLSGPIVAYRDEGAWMMVDDATGVRSWWTGSDGAPVAKLVGAAQHATGDQCLIFSEYGRTSDDSAVCRVWGNCDTGAALVASALNAVDVTGYLIGSIDSPVDGSPVIRQAFAGQDGATSYFYIRGDGGSVSVTHPFLVGTTAKWNASRDNEDPEIRSARHHFAERTDDFAFVVGATPQRTRIATDIAVEVRGPGRRGRP